MSLTETDIGVGLRRLGLKAGDSVEVHGSLSAFGHVDGGAAAVIEALLGVVECSGSIVMSAYRVGAPVTLTATERARGVTWKVPILPEDHDDRSGMGVIADEFRRRSDTEVGRGVHRTCAWGRDASAHTEGFARLVEDGGRVLLLGVGIDRCSSLHLAETTVGIPDAIASLTAPPDEVLRDYPQNAWSIGYGETPKDAWGEVWAEARRAGLVETGRIGEATCHLFSARAMLGVFEDRLRDDPYELFGVTRVEGRVV